LFCCSIFVSYEQNSEEMREKNKERKKEKRKQQPTNARQFTLSKTCCLFLIEHVD